MAKAAANAWAARNAQFETGNNATSVITERDTNTAHTVLWHQVSTADGGCLVIAPVTEIEPVVMALERDPGKLPQAHPLRAILTGDMRKRLRFLNLYDEDYDEDAPSGGARRSLRMAAASSGARPADAEDGNVAAVRAEWAAQQQSKWDKLRAGDTLRAPQKTGGRLGAGVKEGVTDAKMPIKVVVKGFELDGPLTHWNQSTPANDTYNRYTPQNSVCGCVATAAAAMMQFFRVAETEETKIEAGQANSACTFNGGPVPGGAATLGGVYDWSKFDGCTTRADYNGLSDDQREILGRVAYDAGVAVGMHWTLGESGATEQAIATAFANYFKFHEVRCVNDPGQDQYAKLIYAQNRANAPVGLGIEAHSVVAVGYGIDDDGVERVRVFMGWGGSGDGWYALPYIDTKSTQGGSNYLSEIVDCVITMVGYQDDNVVPVCGRLLPYINADMTVGGIDTEADEHGFFGARVSASETQNSLVEVVCHVGVTNKSGSVSIGADPGKDSSCTSSGAGICSWVPDPILFPLLNSEVALSFLDAREKSIASITNGTPKPVLAFSGNWGEPATDAAWDYLYALDQDEATMGEFTNKYVVLCTPFSLSNLSESDGNPSIGVFDGRAISADVNKIWSFYNGRLAYWSIGGSIYTNVENQAELDIREFFVTNSVDGTGFIVTNGIEELVLDDGVEFEYNGNVPASYITGWGVTNGVMDVMEDGLTNFLVRASGVSVSVTNVLMAGAYDYEDSPMPATAPELDYGVYTTSNGVSFVSAAPEFATNAAGNVEFRCAGCIFSWTNTTDGATWVETNYNVTAQSIDVTVKDVAYTIAWFWEPYRVKVTANAVDDDYNTYDTVEPGSGWFQIGTLATFKAKPPPPDNGYDAHFLNWETSTTADGQYLSDADMFSMFGDEVTVFVERPVTVRALFGYAEKPPAWGSFNLVVTNVCFRKPGGGGFSPDPMDALAREANAILDGSALTNGEIVATVAPNTLHQGTALVNNATNTVQKLGVSSMKLAADTLTGTDGQSYVCCGWLVTRHVTEYNNVKEVFEDVEEPVDMAYISDGYALTFDDSGLVLNGALQPTVAGVRTGNTNYEYKYPVEDGDTLTLTWLWKPGTGGGVSKEFNIQWNDALDNLTPGGQVDLLPTAVMDSKGWTTDDLVVTAPTGWVVNVRNAGGRVFAELLPDYAALSAAMDTCALTIFPNDGGSGTYTVQADVAEALRGFWYVLYGSDDLAMWEAVASGTYESGTSVAQGKGTAEAPITPVTLSIVVTPGDTAAGAKRFYKVVSGATADPLAETP